MLSQNALSLNGVNQVFSFSLKWPIKSRMGFTQNQEPVGEIAGERLREFLIAVLREAERQETPTV
jgi:hypothetical protein